MKIKRILKEGILGLCLASTALFVASLSMLLVFCAKTDEDKEEKNQPILEAAAVATMVSAGGVGVGALGTSFAAMDDDDCEDEYVFVTDEALEKKTTKKSKEDEGRTK